MGQSVEECTAPLVPLCRLPCSNYSGKPLLTARRLIDDQLAPYAKSLSLSEPENSVYWDTSPEYRIRTKYAKSVFRLVLDRLAFHSPISSTCLPYPATSSTAEEASSCAHGSTQTASRNSAARCAQLPVTVNSATGCPA